MRSIFRKTNSHDGYALQRLATEERLMRLMTTFGIAMAAALITGFAGVAHAANIPVTNAGFETPVGPDGVVANTLDGSDPAVGWVKTGGGQIYNPVDNSNAPEGSNSYLILEGVGGQYAAGSGSGSILQQLDDVLREGAYTLTVQVGENSTAASVFGSGYQVELGYIDGDGVFQMLAIDDSSLSPVNEFLTSTVLYAANGSSPGFGSDLAIRLSGEVIEGTNNQVLFDDVQLDFVAAPGDRDVYLKVQPFDKILPSGGGVAMWGFATCDSTFTTCAAPTETDAPGPRIDAFAGYDLRIHVLNTLAIPVSINIPGQTGEVGRVPVMMTDDLGRSRVQSFTHETPTGSVAADAVTYTWTNLSAGTYLYQSGTFASLQVPMGLYGALVVNEDPPGSAFGHSYNTEALLVFSEIDPVQNNRVAAAATALPTEDCVPLPEYEQHLTGGYPCTVDYSPMFFLVNGGATADLPAGDPNQFALLRLVNAGLRSHTPAIVGVDFGLIAEDGKPYSLQRNQSAALLAAGKSLDAIIDLPDTNITYSLFDRMPPFANENLPSGSGSIATLQVGTGTPPVVTPASPAQDDTYKVTEDLALTVPETDGVLSNDTGLSGATAVSGPVHGSLVLNGDGSFTYTPNADYSGKDSFTYSASDEPNTNTYGARVTLNVSFENDAPVAVADAYTNNVGSAISVAAPGVLGNDADADGDQLYAILDSGTVTLDPEGSFETNASGVSNFTYIACDAPVPADGECSDPVTVELTVNTASGVALNVWEPAQDGTGPTAVTDYRWTLQLDRMFHPNPADPLAEESLATTFHRSYMPVVAQGCVGTTACSDDETQTPFSEAVLDPTLHYYVSVLPADAMWEDETGFRVGHTIGGAAIPPGATSVSVNTHPEPLEYAQISIKIFNDNAPTNGSVDGSEQGLGGVTINLEDAGGRYGMSAGLLSFDADGNPLRNALDCFESAPPPGVIMSCPDTAANQAAEIVGEVLIKNLFPGKYGIIATAPTATSDGTPVKWVQTSTIEGTKVIDAWVKSGEPPFFAEFGPAGWHAFIGFVNPDDLNAARPASGGATISGAVTNNHMSRPPDQTLWDSETYHALAHTRPWVGLNTLAGTGPNIAAVQATVIDDPTSADDGKALFEIPNVPDGDYQLVIWDTYLDQVIAYRAVSLVGGVVVGTTDNDVGNIKVFNWFARLEHHVFLDENQNGIRDPDELPISEQAVNVRWRDGTMYQSFPTDLEGFVPFDQMFPFFHWLVAEVDYARFKATGLTVKVDAGGDVSGTGNILNPQQQHDAECEPGTAPCVTRTEHGPVLTEGFQAFLGQTNVYEWGKAPYAPGENGGISGIVYYAVTRAENDPRLAAGEPWEPGIPGVTVRLYRQVLSAPTSIAVTNGSFEYPPLIGSPPSNLLTTLDGSDPLVGWVKTGGGQIYNPGDNRNASDGLNSYLILNDIAGYDLGSGSIEQRLSDLLTEGTYTLTVQVGENVTASSSFGSYKVQLGVFDGSEFVLLAEDNNSLAPSDGFLTSTVEYMAAVSDVNLGLPLMIRLVGDVAGTGNIQVLFDDVQLTYSDNGLALVAETVTDSWDESLPSGCPGANAMDAQIVGLGPDDPTGAEITTKCYDGLRNFNQSRPAVFDGGYAFGATEEDRLPPGRYVVEVVPPAGYEILKEEDVNVGFGDSYAVPPLPTPGGAVIPTLPPYEAVTAAMAPEPGLAQPPCVGAMREVPDKLSLFPAANAEAPFRRDLRPLCDRKAVVVSDQGQSAADFWLITDAPIAGQFVGMVLDDVAQEFNPLSPQFGEKWAPPFVPVSIRDYKGLEISRVYSDQWGRINSMLPSTYTANMPSPSGFSPAMHMTCMNDPGPIPDPGNPGQWITDPQYNPAYSNFCYTFQYMPGATTYLDTPVLPVSAFASGYNPPDCELSTTTPMIYSVDGDAAGVGPLVAAGGTLTITSMGTGVEVPNPAYEGPPGQKTISRDYDFGGVEGTVTIGGVALTITSWDANTIVASLADDVGDPLPVNTGQLVVTRGDNGNSTEYAVTVTVSSETPVIVSAGGSIQDAIDNAAPGSLILVEPGTYNESVIMTKPVRLQGAGSGSTLINAVKRPTEAIAQWRTRMDGYFGIGGTRVVDPLPNQPDGAAGFDVSEGAGITVLGPVTGAAYGTSFLDYESRLDGFGITGADVGGGILVNSNAHNLEISNNHVYGNNGSWHGGIRIGEPFLQLAAPVGGGYGFNTGVNMHHNQVNQNGGLDGAGGGISIASGSDGYSVTDSFVCGNFSMGDGGGIGHLGLSPGGAIGNNRILYNQTFNQATPVGGGGVFVGGEPPVAGELTLGSGDVNINANLIQGNEAGAGPGGGIRTQYVNGQDIADAITVANNGNLQLNYAQWHKIQMNDNTIVNNVAATGGAGVSLQDTARPVVFRNNTVAHNDSTATAGGLIVNNVSTNQVAGVDTALHSGSGALFGLADAMPDGSVQGNNPGTTEYQIYRLYSSLDLGNGANNNTLWENRSFHYDASGASAILVPDLSQTSVGECPTGAMFWDLDPLLGGDAAPVTTSAANPGFTSPYCNGGRTLDTTPGPMFALPALDEGGNAWVEVRFGPLTPAWPEGSAPWSY
jgi:FtsP/CotA-like multicopper oxidase with cupredoxin domain